jgi:hypothetical protein
MFRIFIAALFFTVKAENNLAYLYLANCVAVKMNELALLLLIPTNLKNNVERNSKSYDGKYCYLCEV